ncbi:D-isomer specific 2-hydroxyacid dehydrogenase, NAD binding domain-containing protein [Cladophialophora immunda]|nr:D-isomer specific 2-hydroxyacid dehydrogenase, NAD binding domain-containing protein [Cladophialophora immunda]
MAESVSHLNGTASVSGQVPIETTEVPTYTIIQADGVYPDDVVERPIFTANPTHAYKLNYVSTHLFPTGTPVPKPWSSIPKDLRDQVDGIMVLKMGFTAADVELFPKLKVIVRMGVGYDRLDRVALAKKGVTVCNVPDYGTAEIADHALALSLSLRRGVLLHHDRQRQPYVYPWMYIDTPLVSRIQQATFGILGLGRIGTAACLRAKAFGWNVLFYDPYLPNGVDKALGIERTKDIAELFRRSTNLSIHCACTRETRGMICWDLVKLMPRGAVLVNTARGEVLQLDAVERALREGILAGAGLDVLPEEPIPEHNVHPLIRAYREKEEWLLGRMVLTCHTAFYSPQSFVDIRVKSAQTMREVLIDGLQSNVITPDML